MKTMIAAAAATFAMALPAFAEGDAEAGEKNFKKCKSCHKIESPEGEVIFKGGKTGPNLYGVIGRAAGSGDFKYGKDMVAAGEGGLVWDTENLATFLKDPKAFMKDVTGDSKAKTKMTFKLKKGGEDVAAFLASVAPAPEAEEEAASE